MATKGKNYLIIEKLDSNLVKSKNGDDYILEGVFAEFGVRNRNNRIYEEEEYLPHLQYLNDYISKNKLLGELDHPNGFEVNLKNTSHIIESLTYNKEEKKLYGRIRLLNTPAGKIAKQLLEDGVPLSISSRSAGTVDNSGKVKINRIVTYDLVANPGFESADLRRVNESLGVNLENVDIYELSDRYYKDEDYENNKKEYMDNELSNDYKDGGFDVKSELKNIKDYLNYIKYIICNFLENTDKKDDRYEDYGMSRDLNDRIDIMEEYIKYISNLMSDKLNESESGNYDLNDIVEYLDYTSREVNKLKYTKNGNHNLNDIFEYLDYMSSEVNKISKPINENDLNIKKSEDEIIESVINNIRRKSRLLKEEDELEDNDDKKEDLKDEDELEDKKEDIKEEDELEDNDDKKDDEDEIIESVINNIRHKSRLKSRLLKEEDELEDKKEDVKEDESEDELEDKKEEIESKFKKYESERESVNSIIESVDKLISYINKKESDKKEKSDDIKEIFNANKEKAIESVIKENYDPYIWIKDAPEDYKKYYESLNESEKDYIKRKASLLRFDTKEKINLFWESLKIKKINESEELNKNTSYSNDYVKIVANALKAKKQSF